jgi:acetyl esterase/lipase
MHRRDAAGVPRVNVTLGVRAHVLADDAIRVAFARLRRPPTDLEWARTHHESALAADRFAREGWLGDVRAFHPEPAPLTDPALRASRAAQRRVERMKFDSRWVPPTDIGRDRWVADSTNAIARATVLRHRKGPRPWVICIHGTEMGRDADLRSFRVGRLYDELGCNVVLPILPLHGPRRGESAIQLPSIDVMDNVHGLAQAAHDVRRIVSWVREQQPTRIAIMGVSLGGYVTALVAGLEREPFDCVLPIIPATDFPSLFRRQSPPDIVARLDAMDEATRAVHSVVSPLRFTTVTPRSRRAIAAGLADKLIDPVDQVAPLWEHWDRPLIHWYPGGHVGHLVRRDLRTFIITTLSRSGIATV